MDARQCRWVFRARSGVLMLLALLAVFSVANLQLNRLIGHSKSPTEDTHVAEVLDIEPILSSFAVTESLPTRFTTPATLRNLSDLNSILEVPTGHCNRLAELGGTWFCQGFDGNKDVCFDPWFQPPFNSCLAYSFGVGHDITFEDALVQVWGCRIYMHDYSVNDTRHEYHERHIFRQQGIANRSYIDPYGNEFVSYRDALAINDHLDSQIHYLKIDTEGAENEIIPDMITSGLLSNVWQLHMEVHAFRNNDTDQWLNDMEHSYAMVRQLEDSGFKRVRTTVNNLVKYSEESTGIPGCCNDILWINTKRIPKHSRLETNSQENLETLTNFLQNLSNE